MNNKLKALILLICAFTALSAVPRNLVIVEMATGTWCQYCPGGSMGAHDLLANGHAVAIIKNHGGDTFANTYSNARNTFYGVTGYPTTIFDGTVSPLGGSNSNSMYNSYLPYVNNRLNVPSKYTISAIGTEIGGSYSIEVTVGKPEADTNTNVVLHASLTESHIPFNWFNQTTVDNCHRLMIPNQNGTPISLATGGQTNVNLNFTPNAAWVPQNLELVLWLQNTTTKEILQGTKYSLPGLTGALPVSHNTVNFPTMYISGAASVPVTFFNFGSSVVTASFNSDNPAFVTDVNSISIPAYQSRIVNFSFLPQTDQLVQGNITATGNFMHYPSIVIPVSGTGFYNIAPEATNVGVSGIPVIFQVMSGSYMFSDGDGNTEGTTIKKWYKLVDGNPVPIQNANQMTYTTKLEDMGFPIAFEVIPVDQHGMPGIPVLSEPTLPIENIPIPQNFNAELNPPDSVVLTWQRPMYFESRGFVGYKLYRNNMNIGTFTNPNTLTFTDNYLPDGTHEYWIRTMFTNPMLLSDPSPSVFVTVGEISNDDPIAIAVSSIFAYPNPFKDNTSFVIKNKSNSLVRLNVYNIKGQLIKHWMLNTDADGSLNIDWDGTDNNSNKVESGVYLYRVESNSKTSVGKIIRIKK